MSKQSNSSSNSLTSTTYSFEEFSSLRFDLRRCAQYHRSEAIFCQYVAWLSPLLVVVCAGVMYQFGFLITKDTTVILSAVAGGGGILTPLALLRRQRNFHADSAGQCEKWLARLDLQPLNGRSFAKVRGEFRSSWADQPKKYVIHYAVDAKAYNAAVERTYSADMWPQYRIKLGWKERMFAHFFPFSGQHIRAQR